ELVRLGHGTSSAALQTAVDELADESTSRKAFYNLVRKIGDGPQKLPAAQRESLLKRIRRTVASRRQELESPLLTLFLHTEDIRRAQTRWSPRKLSDEYASALFEQLRKKARKYYVNAKTGYVLVPTYGERVVDKRRKSLTYVTGSAAELVLHALDWPDHAPVLIVRPELDEL